MRRSKRVATLRSLTSAAACVAALLWAAPVAAQTWGVKGGLNLSDVTLEDFDTAAEPSAVLFAAKRISPSRSGESGRSSIAAAVTAAPSG